MKNQISETENLESEMNKKLWDCLDEVARQKRLSISGLAKLATMDATAFNKSKRIDKNGRARWPSSESIYKALNAADYSLVEFAFMVEDKLRPASEAGFPLLRLADLQDGQDSNALLSEAPRFSAKEKAAHMEEPPAPNAAKEYEESAAPAQKDFALLWRRLRKETDAENVWRETILIVSFSAPPKIGAFALLGNVAGAAVCGRLLEKTPYSLEIESDAPEKERLSFPVNDLAFALRVKFIIQT